MPDVHAVVGFAVVAVFAVGWIWGLGGWLVRRSSGGPGRFYWIWLVAAQIVAALQALLGLILLLLGYRPSTWLHLVYGFGPLLILAIAHSLAREGQNVAEGQEPIPPYVWFAGAAFICFGLTLRALQTGLSNA
jgi:hypothetical protein